MNATNQTDRRSTALLGILLALGLIIGGWVLGAQIKATRLSDRYVTVKGLVERTVKSDLAIWSLSYKEAGDDLSLLYAKTEADKKTILQFLDQQGIQTSEIELGVLRVVDTQANEYGGGNRPPHRYIVEQVITVRTPRVDQVAAAAQKTGSKVGSIRQANQGVFSILPADQGSATSEPGEIAGGEFGADSGLMKTVRIVTTVQYYLDK
jgi:hypothetical protein